MFARRWRTSILVAAIVALLGLGTFLALSSRRRAPDLRTYVTPVPPPPPTRGPVVERAALRGSEPLAWLYEPGVMPRKIAGRVIDETGAPVPGARVELRLDEAPALDTVVTGADEQGLFDFGHRPRARYRVSAWADSLGEGHAVLAADDVDVATEDVVLRLPKCSRQLAVHVRTMKGEPIGTAVIVGLYQRPFDVLSLDASYESPQPVFVGHVDDSGNAHVCATTTMLRVSAPGFATTTLRAAIIGDELLVTLLPSRPVRGQVVDEAGKPIGGAVVSLVSGRDAIAQVATDASGEFSFDAGGEGPQMLVARHGESAGVASVASATNYVTVQLSPRCRTIAGVVQRAARPLAGVEVVFMDGSAMSQEDGSFVLRCARNRGGWLGVTGRRLDPPVLVPAGTDRIVDLVLTVRDVGAVTGVVMESGRPVPAAKVQLMGRMERERWTMSDGGGRFVIEGLAPDRYTINASTAMGHGAEYVQVGAGETKDVTVQVEAGGILEGHVREADGTPVAGVTVVASPAYVGLTSETATDADGNFMMRLPEVWPFHLTVVGRELAPRRIVSAYTTRSKPTKIDLQLAPVSTISGVVVDDNNTPVAGAVVTMGDIFAGDYRDVTDDGGRFEFVVHSIKKGRLQAFDGDGRFGVSHTVAAGEQDVRIVLRATGSVSGSVHGCAGEADIRVVPGAAVTRTVGGAFEVFGVPEGDGHVLAHCSHGSAEAEVTVVAGRTTAVDLAIEGLGSVAARLVGPAPEHISEYWCSCDGCFGSGGFREPTPEGTFDFGYAPAGDVLIECESRGWADHHDQAAVWVTVQEGTTFVEIPIGEETPP